MTDKIPSTDTTGLENVPTFIGPETAKIEHGIVQSIVTNWKEIKSFDWIWFLVFAIIAVNLFGWVNINLGRCHSAWEADKAFQEYYKGHTS